MAKNENPKFVRCQIFSVLGASENPILDPRRERSYKIVLVILISYPFFSKTALTIFLKLGTMLDIDKLRKVTKPDYP